MKNSTVARVVFCVAVTTTLGRAGAQDAKPADKHKWDYGKEHGPDHWGNLKPEFAPCRTGHRQSPIDIQKTEKADLPTIQFDYEPSPLRITDNGHTILVTYAPGSSIRVGDTRYQLKQFHFHRPSEEKIHGKTYDMVAHLVHADPVGHLAVVAVLLEQGAESPLVRALWRDIPKQKEKEALLQGVQINVAELLPADRGYYTFEGSLTTPPCSESVTWFVLKQPFHVSASEIADSRSCTDTTPGQRSRSTTGSSGRPDSDPGSRLYVAGLVHAAEVRGTSYLSTITPEPKSLFDGSTGHGNPRG